MTQFRKKRNARSPKQNKLATGKGFNAQTHYNKNTAPVFGTIGYSFQGENLVGISATEMQINWLRNAYIAGELDDCLSDLNSLGRYKDIIVRDLPGFLGGGF
ncbi:hypothetical protein K9N68_33810 [Kovacikia minuta CCNUW1]|uniref:hypothetical protein n=1 Tax=Kovacikia minuta TaxID=2931930 RepID=UPI001CCE4F0E|nr:hypothetical protein [Kovacikia minuta]UBF26419.1 hypothetical protein K9N68_33810 [Kovacikia minuta CCNUW1]